MKKKTIWKIIGIALGSLVLLCAIGGVFVFRHYFGMLKKPEDVASEPVTREIIEPLSTPAPSEVPITPEPAPTPDPNDPLAVSDVYSILLLGADARWNDYSTRTDTMMLVTINKTNKEIILTSFLRDTYIFIPDFGYQRLNVANVVGGPQRTIDTLTYNFGIVIDNFAFVNFFTFMDVVDAIGGIEIGLDDIDVQTINNWIWDDSLMVDYSRRQRLEYTSDGQYTLNGMQALAYCRSRDIGGDLRRAEQQRRENHQDHGIRDVEHHDAGAGSQHQRGADRKVDLSGDDDERHAERHCADYAGVLAAQYRGDVAPLKGVAV